MPSITTVHESLPYVDAEPTPQQRAAAEALIAAERSTVPDDPFHALLPPPPQPSKFITPLLQSEYERAATGTKLSAIDFSRYEVDDSDDVSSLSKDELALRLSRTYTSKSYISSRRAHLALLDSYGKNAWLVGNWHLEGELKALEKELADTKREIDLVTLQRTTAQEEAGPEIQGLEDTWKRGVGRVLETEAAAEQLRREVIEAKKRITESS
ncbi:Pre-mRNA-splicing factor SPF27 [Diplogelasinospora grovesii]|uniref:Pre-mRNA-splicing factor SPF27 n=1 Tax=Diplogelasinospora grovesii TaxID=303347 RepID=A0AAN6NIX8_9PEZI|nr:Pre-mRNA-splicing factor SPF27 [Diplogelasinospora grovesii]